MRPTTPTGRQRLRNDTYSYGCVTLHSLSIKSQLSGVSPPALLHTIDAREKKDWWKTRNISPHSYDNILMFIIVFDF